jgi:hypothetical protein
VVGAQEQVADLPELIEVFAWQTDAGAQSVAERVEAADSLTSGGGGTGSFQCIAAVGRDFLVAMSFLVYLRTKPISCLFTCA